jgi:hypothetical protein
MKIRFLMRGICPHCMTDQTLYLFGDSKCGSCKDCHRIRLRNKASDLLDALLRDALDKPVGAVLDFRTLAEEYDRVRSDLSYLYNE